MTSVNSFKRPSCSAHHKYYSASSSPLNHIQLSISIIMDPLGKPVGGDDHGSGVGLSGGVSYWYCLNFPQRLMPSQYGQPNAQNTQAGMMAANEKTGFNAGVGGAHASGGEQVPRHFSSQLTLPRSAGPAVWIDRRRPPYR